jgi:hypothetical protein
MVFFLKTIPLLMLWGHPTGCCKDPVFSCNNLCKKLIFFLDLMSILMMKVLLCKLGWEICLESHGILRLIQFRTFWTPEFSSKFYFSDRKMCSRQIWTHYFLFGILFCHLFFQYHELENVPAISIFLARHENIQLYILAGIPKDI